MNHPSPPFLGPFSEPWQGRCAELLRSLQEAGENYLGYPNNQLLDHQALAPFLDLVINNIGDPEFGNLGLNTCEIECEVIAFFQNLFGLTPITGWGYVTNGGTEGNLHGFFTGRERYPDAPLLFSQDSHYSVDKAGRLLGMRREAIASQTNGELDYDAFEARVVELCQLPLIINVNVGTTMKGAIDNVPRILEILRRNQVERFHIHCDAALFGGFLPFLPDAPHIDFTLPIHSMSISGHKFFGSPIPCGILLTRRENIDLVKNRIDYIGSFDGTISGSRNGLSPLILWQIICRQGTEGFATWAQHCLNLTRYTVETLTSHGWSAWSNRWSNTVVIQRPPQELAKRWHLAVSGDIAHLVIMPSVSKAKIDRFIEELLVLTEPLSAPSSND